MFVLLYYYLLVRSASTHEKESYQPSFSFVLSTFLQKLEIYYTYFSKKENDNLIQKICDDNTCIIIDVLKYQLVE